MLAAAVYARFLPQAGVPMGKKRGRSRIKSRAMGERRAGVCGARTLSSKENDTAAGSGDKGGGDGRRGIEGPRHAGRVTVEAKRFMTMALRPLTAGGVWRGVPPSGGPARRGVIGTTRTAWVPRPQAWRRYCGRRDCSKHRRGSGWRSGTGSQKFADYRRVSERMVEALSARLEAIESWPTRACAPTNGRAPASC